MLKLNPGPIVAWRAAIEQWEAGDKSSVEELLTGRRAIPQFARVWLAQALAGHVKMRRGRKTQPLSEWLRKRLAQVQAQERFGTLRMIERLSDDTSGGTPTERAMDRFATALKSTENKVNWLVYPRKSRSRKARKPLK